MAELFRAVRFVVDTGIHHKRWTREEAIDYMKAHTGMAMSDVVAEIERPGDGLSHLGGVSLVVDAEDLTVRQRRPALSRALPELGDLAALDDQLLGRPTAKVLDALLAGAAQRPPTPRPSSTQPGIEIRRQVLVRVETASAEIPQPSRRSSP